MDRALWLLMRLRLRGWLRRLGRSLASVRGVLLVVVGALVFLPWVLSWVLGSTLSGQHLAEVRRYGPLALAAYCLAELVISTEKAITFSAAEVNFLFPAPLSRRQLLAYKVAAAFGSSLLSAALLTLFLRRYAATFTAAVVGLLLAVLFLQLFPMVLALLASTFGAHAWNRRRKVVLAVLVVLAAVAAWQAVEVRSGRELLVEMENSSVAQTLLAPFRWFVNAFTAEQLWPDLVQWAALGLLVNACLLVAVFGLDAHYLETSAAASERAYARLERLRQGGPTLASTPAARWVRLRAPTLPGWGGVGPVAWRQLVTALRTPRSLLAILLVTGFLIVPAVSEMRIEEGSSVAMALALLFGLALIVTPMLPFDFRADLDRMDILKTLPLPAWRLVLGQLLVPVVLIGVLQGILLVALVAVRGKVEPLVLAGTAFLPPVNCLLFGLDNLLFLWFPTRLAPASPGDLQALGRQMVLWMVKFLVLQVMAGIAFLFGFVVYLLTGGSWVAGAALGWLVLAAFVVGLVPLIALAFRRYDVARDMP
jgi:hypothetical protein